MEKVAAGRSRAESHQHSFELIAGHPALDLVNTLDWRFRQEPPPEELLADYNDLLRFTELSGLLKPRQAARLLRNRSDNNPASVMTDVRELREATAQVAYAAVEHAAPPPSAIKELEACFNRVRRAEDLNWVGTRLTWEFAGSVPPAELPLLLLARSTAELLTSDRLHLLRECGNPECRWLFLDTSKNHTRRWCDMKLCGNRMKARRFKAQHRA